MGSDDIRCRAHALSIKAYTREAVHLVLVTLNGAWIGFGDISELKIRTNLHGFFECLKPFAKVELGNQN